MTQVNASNSSPSRADVLRLAAVQLSYTPNLITSRGSYWAPDEPLLKWAATVPSDSGQAIAGLRIDGELGNTTQVVIDRARERRAENLRLKLKQILDFLIAHRVDVAVFPECLVPVDLIHILAGYRDRIAMFAGVGNIRDRADLQKLRDLGFSDTAAIGDNCAVYIDAIQHRLVTKKFPAEGEYPTSGTGVAEIVMTVRGRTHTVGLAICMDYIKAGYSWLNNGGVPPGLVLVAAMTRKADDFFTKTRDFVTVMANRAESGGSAVVVPRMTGFAYLADIGTAPLPAAEGIVIVDCSGFAKSPSSTTPTLNRIILRPALLYGVADRERAEPSEPSIAEELSGWELPMQLPAGDYLSTALRFANDSRGGNELLRAALTELSSRYRGMRDSEGFRLLTTHLTLRQVQSEDELRYQVLSELLETWHPR